MSAVGLVSGLQPKVFSGEWGTVGAHNTSCRPVAAVVMAMSDTNTTDLTTMVLCPYNAKREPVCGMCLTHSSGMRCQCQPLWDQATRSNPLNFLGKLHNFYHVWVVNLDRLEIRFKVWFYSLIYISSFQLLMSQLSSPSACHRQGFGLQRLRF